jgi:hypothetical protein
MLKHDIVARGDAPHSSAANSELVDGSCASSSKNSFRWRDRNNGMRAGWGKPDESFGEAATGVAYLYAKDRLPANTVLFVRRSGAAECYAIVRQDLVAAGGVHTLRLERVTPRNLLIRLSPSFPGKVGDSVALRLESAPEDPVPKSYFVRFARPAADQSVLVADVLPGIYRARVVDGGPAATPRTLTLSPDADGEWTLVLE